MALAIGTNSGFVTVAPTTDPAASNFAVDTRANVMRDTSSATAARITEVGWWCDTATEEANFEIALYDSNGSNQAGDIIHSSTTNAKGTTAGWKTVAVDWAIDASTDYWLGLQLDDTATTTNLNYSSSGGAGWDFIDSQTSLPDPFGGGSVFFNFGMIGLYAVWDTGAAEGTNMQINRGDVWKSVTAMQINRGDVWKAVTGAQINRGDVWKEIF